MTSPASVPASPTPAPSSSAPATGGDVSRYQRFQAQTVHRRQLRNAPWNPRVLDQSARRKLKASLKKLGLVETLIWNRRSGNLVGGHQRLSILDDLEGTQDYRLTVAVVDMDEATEKAANVAVNNAAAQGQFDLDLLAPLMDGADIEAMGFDKLDLRLLFDDSRLGSMFTDDPAAPDIEHIKQVKREVKESRTRRTDKTDDAEFYLVAVADDRAELDAFLRAVNLPADQRYVSLAGLKDAIVRAYGGAGKEGG